MNAKYLLLSGPKASVAAALAKLDAAPRIVQLAAEDGSVSITILDAMRAKDAIEVDIDAAPAPEMSQVIRLPDIEAPLYVCVESSELADSDAANIVAALHNGAYDKSGFVVSTDQYREIKAPTSAETLDRIVLRDAEGKSLGEIKLAGIDSPARFTAELAYIDAERSRAVVTFAAQDEQNVFAVSPAKLVDLSGDGQTIQLDAEYATELPANVRRSARADKDGRAAYELEDGNTAYLAATKSGSVEIADTAPTMPAIEVDIDAAPARPWECFGMSFAATDESGAPTTGYAQPGDGSVKLRFAPKATPAAEVTGQA